MGHPSTYLRGLNPRKASCGACVRSDPYDADIGGRGNEGGSTGVQIS
jgi:hypothetical protein